MINMMLQGKSILIVDDEKDLREILRDELEAQGVNCEIAENGKKALELAIDKNFDAIISDVRMPKMNGVELAKAVLNLPKNRGSNAPVYVFVTGYSDVSPREAKQMGVHHFLHKPFRFKELLNVICNAFDCQGS